MNPTLAPNGAGEAELARFVAHWLEQRGVEVDIQTLGPGRANVIGRVRGRGGGRTLMLNGHLDTVALGGPDAGLNARLDGRRLYGRGSYDMKGGVAAIMLAAAAAAELDLAGAVIVTAVADEEAFSIGTEAVVELEQADAAIVTEPTELRVGIAHKGFVWLELETTGVAAHGSRYDLGVDAIARMGPVLVGIAELDQRLREDGDPHRVLGWPSLHASLIEGGQELSTYPDRCLVKVERRTLPGEGVALVEQQLRDLAAPAEASVRTLFVRDPLETSVDEPIVKLLTENCTLARSQPAELFGPPYWTDAGLLAAAGIPSVLFGPGGAGAHGDVEWVDLDDVRTCVDVLTATLRTFCA